MVIPQPISSVHALLWPDAGLNVCLSCCKAETIVDRRAKARVTSEDIGAELIKEGVKDRHTDHFQELGEVPVNLVII